MPILGRLACPWCGFLTAHVKQTPGKRAYHHCPECGLMAHAKNGAQERILTDKMRPESSPADDVPRAPGAPGAPVAAAPVPAAPPPKKPGGFWDQLGRGGGAR